MTGPMHHKRPIRWNILLDENFPPRTALKISNNRFNLKHLKHDLGKGGIKDPEVFKLAEKLKRIIITFNDKDFKDLVLTSTNTGVIGVSSSLSN